MKLSLWIGVSLLITFLASSYSTTLENNTFLFILSLGALVVAILPALFDPHQQ